MADPPTVAMDRHAVSNDTQRHLQRGNVLFRSVLGGLVIERED